MRIKHFIVTYKNEDILQTTLNFINSQPIPEGVNYEIYVINNYGYLKPMPNNNFIGLNNILRLDTSTGHLARNWNQALMLGFEDLNNPKSDIVMLSQGDCFFQKDYLYKTIKAHETYEFIQQGNGDEFHSYKAEHIKKTGIWDERFCGIGFQEVDYFYRSCILNTENVAVNKSFYLEDKSHNYFNIIDCESETGWERQDESHLASYNLIHQYCLDFLLTKYGIKEKLIIGENCNQLIDLLRNEANLPEINTNVTYPYFEKDIDKETLEKLNYIDFIYEK
jgi:hypothetical protein